jgi:hypothetical protein
MLTNAWELIALYTRLIPRSLRLILHDLIASGVCLLGLLGAANPARALLAS